MNEETRNEKQSTVNTYSSISSHFHTKLKGKHLRKAAEFKFIPKRKNKLANGHGGKIIQLRAVIFEGIRNDQIGSSNCFHLSSIIVVFMRFSSLIQTLQTSRC